VLVLQGDAIRRYGAEGAGIQGGRIASRAIEDRPCRITSRYFPYLRKIRCGIP
jgi:hypothetical protein